MTERTARTSLLAPAQPQPAAAEQRLPAAQVSMPVTLRETTEFAVKGAVFTSTHPELVSSDITLSIPAGASLTDNGNGSFSPLSISTLSGNHPITTLKLDWIDGDTSNFRYDGLMPGIQWPGDFSNLQLVPKK